MGSRHTMDLPRSMVVPGPSCVHLRSNLLGVQDVDYDGWILCTLGGREGGRITRGPARSDGSRDDDGRKFPQRTSHNTMIRNVKDTWTESRFSLFEILVFTMGCRSERKVTITVHATTIQMTYHKTILKTRFAYRLQARVSHKRPRIV